MEKQKHIFTNRALSAILIPVVIEQALNSLMGIADTMMVSNVGASAISAVSLVDTINILVIQVFSAMAAGGTVVCSQYRGKQDSENAQEAAKQLLLLSGVFAMAVAAFCLAFQGGILRLIFGQVEPDVMRDSRIYFGYTALSFPFIGVFSAGAAIFRAQENTRLPMKISAISNLMNVVGNACLIFGLDMGVKGAALSTLLSRIFCAVWVLLELRKKDQEIMIREYGKIRPDKRKMGMLLKVGIPTGIENGMFQFGKLAVQSTVSTLGTTAIAAQAMTNMLETMNGIVAIGIGIGLTTVAAQCIGADRYDEAIYYTKKIFWITEVVVIISCAVVYLLTRPITILGGMEPESAALCIEMMKWITVVKMLVWTPSYVHSYTLRAAGDVKFPMIMSTVSMWTCRVGLGIFLCRVMDMGLLAVWIGMFVDWTVRGIFYLIRFHSGKWMEFKVIKE